jgi:hypothetical protein
MEVRRGSAAQWTDDVNLAKSFRTKNSADAHIQHYNLKNAFTTEVHQTLVHQQCQGKQYEKIWTSNYQTAWRSADEIVFYVHRKGKANATGNFAVPVKELEEFHTLAIADRLIFRVLLEFNGSTRSFYEYNIEELRLLSIQKGKDGLGDYYLVTPEPETYCEN